MDKLKACPHCGENERERCAQIVDDAGMSYAGLREGVIISRISAAIRAGGDA